MILVVTRTDRLCFRDEGGEARKRCSRMINDQPIGGMKMKRFSKIKETDNPNSKLRMCFEFKADENPAGDLHSVGLIISHGITGWRGGKKRSHSGCAYILTDSREGLEKAQEQLRQKGWKEIAEA